MRALRRARSIAARQQQSREQQREQAEHKAKQERAGGLPAATSAFAPRLLLADPHDEFGVLLERPLTLDEPARDVRGHRADHVGDFIRLGEDAPAYASVVQQAIEALV